MKRSQSNNARPRTRFSRSASSPRKPGWKISISIIVSGTLLLVSVFFLLSRLGGFGSKVVSHKDLENESWIRGELDEEDNNGDELDDQRLKLFEKLQERKLVDGGTREGLIDFSDELDENPEFDSLEGGDEKVEEFDEDELDGDDSGVQELSGLRQQEDEDENEDDFDQETFKNQTNQQSPGRVNEPSEKRLERMEQIKTLPRNIPDEGKNSSGKERFLWDKVLGIIKMPLDGSNNNRKRGGAARKLGLGNSFAMENSNTDSDDSGAKDIDILDKDLLEENEAGDVEDALLLRKDKQHNAKIFGSFSSQKPVPLSNVFDNKFARKMIKPPFDPSNPTGNFLLQDPDTVEPWGLTKSDKAMSRVLRRGDEEVNDPRLAGKARLLSEEKPLRIRERVKGDDRRWGSFPGLDPMLLFSEFMAEFLAEENCQVRVFMAWNSPPWSYTVRHQRGMESLLHFHPGACVVVFSETLEINFFKKFWTKGFRVAVVRPNLEEFLGDTPAEMFASVWLQWRKIDLFYIHYSELLRLAALYKYGGLYLDSDVIVLKPLTSLHNVVGLEVLANGTTRINGAVMAFDKGSLYIKACLEEYTETYDDKLLEWNGADLLTRVVARFNSSKDELHVVASSWFFPVSSSNIISYFQEGNSFELLESYTIHLWNRQSGSLVPEKNSVVEAALEQHCIWCNEII